MGSRHTRLAAALAAAWESEVVSARTLALLAERTHEAHVKARLMVLAAFCRAHASRLLARLSSLGRGPLPVPPEEISVTADFRTRAAEGGALRARLRPALRVDGRARAA